MKENVFNPNNNFSLNDYFRSYNDLHNEVRFNILKKNQQKQSIRSSQILSIQRKSSKVFEKQIQFFQPKIIIFYVILGISMSLIGFSLELSFSWLKQRRIESTKYLNQENEYLGFIYWLILGIIFAVLSTGVCHFFAIEAQGILNQLAGGFVELKCILAGGNKTNYLELRVLIVKILSILFMMAAGFPLGIIAPYMHIGACIAYNLQRLRIFQFIQNDPVLQNQSIMVGASLSFSHLFQAPISTLLVGIEVSEQFYSINSLFLVVISSYFCSITSQRLNNYFHLFDYTIYNKEDSEVDKDYILYIILGICCGLLGSIYVRAQMYMIWFKKQPQCPAFLKTQNIKIRRYKFTIFVIIIVSVMIYYIPGMYLSEKRLILANFQDLTVDYDEKLLKEEVIEIIISQIIKGILLCFCAVPLAGGTMGYLLVIGSSFGRCFGVIVKLLFGIDKVGRFAMAGAAALCCGYAQIFSVVVLVIEIGKHLDNVFPILLSVICSFLIANRFSGSFLNTALQINKFFFLPKLLKNRLYKMKVSQVLQKPEVTFYSEMKIQDVVNFFLTQQQIKLQTHIVVLKSQTEPYLIGIFKTQNLLIYLEDELYCFLEQFDDNQFHQNTKFKEWVRILQLLIHLYDIQNPNVKQQNQLNINGTYLKDKAFRIFQKAYLRNQDQDYVKSINQIQNYDDNDETEEINAKKEFYNRKINFNSKNLGFISTPLVVSQFTNLKQIHFLFIKTQVEAIYVTNQQNQFIGCVTANQLFQANENLPQE